MRILVIHNAGRSDLPSGESSVVEDEVSSLSKAGHTVKKLIVSNDQINNRWQLLLAGINVFWSFRSYRVVEQAIREFQPDIAHFHTILPLLTPSAFFACRKYKVPVVQTLHNCRYLCVEGAFFRNNFYCDLCFQRRNSIYGILYRCSRGSFFISKILTFFNLFYLKSGLLFKAVDHFIAVSDFIRDIHVKVGFPEEKVSTKYNGIDTSLFPEVKKSSSTARGESILFVGRLVPAKGTRILQDLMLQFPSVKFDIVGEGPDYTMLQNFIRDNSLSQVEMHGRLPFGELIPLFDRALCLIVPSVCGESFGRIAVEAMLLHTPVVVSNFGGLAEIVKNSEGGFTVDPVCSPEFASAIESLAKNQNLAIKMGDRGYNFAINYYSLDNSTKNLLDLYEKIIHKKNR